MVGLDDLLIATMFVEETSIFDEEKDEEEY